MVQPNLPRRQVLQGGAMGALAFTVGGVEALMSPREAHAQGAAFKVLTAQEVETIEALGDTLAVGAKKAGIANLGIIYLT